MSQVSQYEHRYIYDQKEYSYETKEWSISSKYFRGLEPDHTLIFSSQKALSDFIYEYLLRGTV